MKDLGLKVPGLYRTNTDHGSAMSCYLAVNNVCTLLALMPVFEVGPSEREFLISCYLCNKVLWLTFSWSATFTTVSNCTAALNN